MKTTGRFRKLETLLVVTLMCASFTLCPTPLIAQKSQKAIDYYNSGLRKQESGDLDGALADYDKALALEPRLADAYNNRANIKLQKGDLDGAIGDYSKAIELKPRSVETYFNRGVVRLQKGDNDGAIADFTSSIA